MSVSLFLWLAIIGLLITCLAATGTKVLRGFSRSELEDYCKKRNRLDLFGLILDDHDDLAVAAETLQVVGTILMVVSCGYWLVILDAGTTEPMLRHFVACLGIGAVLLTAATSWIPLAIVRLWSAPFLYRTWSFWKLVDRVLWPLTIGEQFADLFMRRLAGRHESEEDEEEAFEDEVHAILSEGQRDGLLEPDAREMIEGVIELGDNDVSDVMTPRSQVDAIDVHASSDEIIKFVIDVRRTRIPVYDGSLDNIVGILYAKDLLPELSKSAEEPRTDLRELVRPAWYVPGTKALDSLLHKFQETRNHMAIVRDEYGGVKGLITIEDVLEEIVGEIADEYDQQQDDEIRILREGLYQVAGWSHLTELNEVFGMRFPEPEDYDTIGGFIVERLGHIPKEGEAVEHDGLLLSVVKANRRAVEQVHVELLNESKRETA